MAQHFKKEEETVVADVETSEEKPKKKHRGRKFAAVAAVLVLAVAGGTYAYGRDYFTTHFVPGTTVDGIDASWLTVDELAKEAEKRFLSYTNHLTGAGLDLTFSAADLGLSLDGKAWAKEALDEADEDVWFVDALEPKTYEPTVEGTLDEDKLANTVKAAVETFNETATPPTNAYITFDEESGRYTIAHDERGTELSEDSVVTAVAKEVREQKASTEIGDEQLAAADIDENDERLANAVKAANTILDTTLTLTFNGEELPVSHIDSSITRDWLHLDEAEDGIHVYLDEEKSYQWCFDNLNSCVNGEDETHGWEVSSPDTAASIRDALYAGESKNLEVSTYTSFVYPDESEGARERGRHIDVNLSTQFARLYDENGNVLWKSFIVSGDPSWGHQTPTGEYTINSMQQDVTLTGLNNGYTAADAENNPDATYTSHVRYWMCFLGNAYGLHDADWRWDSEFGGETYLWNGSHGCVNLPVGKAAELYGLVHVGDKVIIHN